jgi:NAD(P)-dependent dehydrogenase (short-subunit alcohol dehydrogenase family)
LLNPPPSTPARQVFRVVGSTLLAQRWRCILGTSAPRLRTVVVSGGVTGIVAPCALALDADHVVFVGRRPEGHDDVQALLRSHGPRVSYRQVDLLDADATKTTLDDLPKVDLVIHGAGVLRDAPAHTLKTADVRDVIAPKVAGFLHLRAALPHARVVAFSSITAHVGNQGQLAYSAANAALEALTSSIAWSAWSDVGMASDRHMQTAIKTKGVQSLSPTQGAAAFADIVELDEVTIVTRERHIESSHPWPLDAIAHPHPLRARLHLSPADAGLVDHRVSGRCLVPAAVWIDAIAELLDRQTEPLAIEHFHVAAPTFVDQERDDIYIELSALGHRAAVKVIASETVVATAMTCLCARPPSAVYPAVTGPNAHALYRQDLLFHGPAWQVLEAVEVINGTVRARLVDKASRAAAVDAAHQLASVWMGWNHGHLGLPVSATTWSWWPDGPAVYLEIILRRQDGQTTADLIARNKEGSAVLHAQQVCMTPASQLQPAARAVIQEHTHE